MTGEPVAPGASEKKTSGRLVSLDAFRGFVIASMLLVNATWGESGWGEGTGAWLAEQLGHVAWNDPLQGATFTDLVFPWFLFIMGAAVPLSMRSGRGRDRSALARLGTAARRGLLIYLLGVLVTFAGVWTDRPVAWTDLLSWNILQLIGAAYVAATAISLAPKWAWWVAAGVILAGKGVAMGAIDAGWVRGVMEGAGLAPRVAEGGPAGPGTFTHYDDVKRFLAREHVEASGAWGVIDRRFVGWLGMAQQWLPCAAIALLGALATDRLLGGGASVSSRGRRARDVGLGGVAACALGLLLSAGYRAEGGGWLGPATMPMSKWFFTPSYCLFAAGSGAVLLAGFYWVIDVRGWRRSAEPWRTYGVNALALYVGAELVWKLAALRWKVPVAGGEGSGTSLPGGVNAWVASVLPEGVLLPLPGGSLSWSAVSGVVFALVWLGFWFAVCRWLDRRKLYLKV